MSGTRSWKLVETLVSQVLYTETLSIRDPVCSGVVFTNPGHLGCHLATILCPEKASAGLTIAPVLEDGKLVVASRSQSNLYTQSMVSGHLFAISLGQKEVLCQIVFLSQGHHSRVFFPVKE